MRRAIVVALVGGLLGFGGSRAASAQDMSLGLEPTGPAGWSDNAPGSLPERIVHRAREFRGNPMPLAILTGVVLLVALGLGVHTIRLAYRQPAGPGGS